MDIWILGAIFIVTIIMEWIDSGIGMGYGTVLSPLLISIGFPALQVVPAILISQALGGITASYIHHKMGNADLNFFKKTEDSKAVLLITTLGVVAAIGATFLASHINKTALNVYIALLVAVMGILLLSGFHFKYSYGKMYIVGITSAFNKALSGGGYGPVVTGGQILLGKDHKRSISCTTAAEPLICLVSFVTYLILNGLSNITLIVTLVSGAFVGALFGPHLTHKVDKKKMVKIIAVLLVVLAILCMLSTFGIINLKLGL